MYILFGIKDLCIITKQNVCVIDILRVWYLYYSKILVSNIPEYDFYDRNCHAKRKQVYAINWPYFYNKCNVIKHNFKIIDILLFIMSVRNYHRYMYSFSDHSVFKRMSLNCLVITQTRASILFLCLIIFDCTLMYFKQIDLVSIFHNCRLLLHNCVPFLIWSAVSLHKQ